MTGHFIALQDQSERDLSSAVVMVSHSRLLTTLRGLSCLKSIN